MLLLSALACNLPGRSSAPIPTLQMLVTETAPADTLAPSSTSAPTPTLIPPTPTPIPPLPRIGVHAIRPGQAEFYNLVTSEKFTPRGVNYNDYQPVASGYEDRFLAADPYNPSRVRAAFELLAGLGFNTVRINLSGCQTGDACIGNPDEDGLNPQFLDNLTDVLSIARENHLYLIITVGDLPEKGGYREKFTAAFAASEHGGFDSPANAFYLHPAGVQTWTAFWSDLMAELQSRQAAFDAVLGWSLADEYYLNAAETPLTLTTGNLLMGNGKTYVLNDPKQRRQMPVDATLTFLEGLIPVIKQVDPQALVTMGFQAPNFPNAVPGYGDRYTDTAPLLLDSPLDFYDFHAHSDSPLPLNLLTQNFGSIGFGFKPVIMGATGAGRGSLPSAASALSAEVLWMQDSCSLGYDGWLHSGYFAAPEDLPGATWSFLDGDEQLLNGLAPANLPDPCAPPRLAITNLAYQKTVRATRQQKQSPASAAVDGRPSGWQSGAKAPQWVEIDLRQAASISRVGMIVAQDSPGTTRHQVWVRLSNGRMVFVAEFYGQTAAGDILAYDLPVGLDNVRSVRILTLESPAPVAWTEIEVLSAPKSPANGCFVVARGKINLRASPDPEAQVQATLKFGEGAYIEAQSKGTDGEVWYRLASSAWVQSKVVNPFGGCASLPAE